MGNRHLAIVAARLTSATNGPRRRPNGQTLRMQHGHMSGDEPWGSTLTAEALATATSMSVERLESLVAAGILMPDDEGRFTAGDVHVVRLIGAFEANGVSLDALRAARAGGRPFVVGRKQPERPQPLGWRGWLFEREQVGALVWVIAERANAAKLALQ